MTKLLEKAVEAVRNLTPDEQDHIARAMLTFAGAKDKPEEIEPQDLADVLEGLAQAQRREFATDAEMTATFRLFGA